MKKLWIAFAGFLLLASCANTQQEANNNVVEKQKTTLNLSEFKNIELLAPDTENKAPLMAALENRRTSRDFSDKELYLEDLSNVLWAAYGVNRPDGKRTAPSAMAVYPVDVYAVLSNGIYFYDAPNNALRAIAEGDFRRITGGQDFVYDAPLNILYVVDLGKYEERFSAVPKERLINLAISDASHSSQNVYLWCAAFDMKTVIRGGGMNEPELLKLLNLDETKHIIPLAQTIGY